MKKIILITSCLVFSNVSYSGEINGDVNSTFASDFVSGSTSINWVDGPVWMPSANVNYTDREHHYSLGAWTVINLDDTRGFDNSVNVNGQVESNEGQATEWDLFLSYKYTGFEAADITAGYIRYEFNQLNAHTSDVYIKFSSKNWYLKPYLQVLYDTDGQNEGSHAILGVSHDIALGDYDFQASASASWAGKGYARAYFSDDRGYQSGISNWTFSLAHAIELENLTLVPKITYYRLRNSRGILGKSHQQWSQLAYEGNDSEHVVASLNIAYAF